MGAAVRLVIATVLASVVLVAVPGRPLSAAASGTNVLLGRPVVACPQGAYGGTTCEAVNDGNDATRYIASVDGDWWIVIDAGALVTVKDYRVVGPTHEGGGLCNEGGAKTIAGYTANPTILNADPSMVFYVHTTSVPCWDGVSVGTIVDGTLPRPFTARYFLISGHSFFYGGWNEFSLFESAPLVPPTSDNVLLDRPVVSCPAGNYATDFGSGNCGDVNDGDDATRYTAAADGLWSVVIDAGSDVPVKNFHVAGPTPIPGGCSQGNAKISGFSSPPFTVGSATMVFQHDLANQCWVGVTLDGTLPQTYTARFFMISGVSFYYGGWNELALYRAVVANPNPVVDLTCPASPVFVHDGAVIRGRFSAPDGTAVWRATYDGFNQAGPAPLALAADHTFSLSVGAPLLSAGTFHVVVRVTDGATASGQAACTLTAVPKRAMLYVHGTTGSAAQDPIVGPSDFPSLFGRLARRYPFFLFTYYEDAANRAFPSFACEATGQRQLPSIDPQAGMPLDFGTAPDPAPGTCDSNDDVELNAVLLDQDVAALADDFDDVTLISNSGGGRIVRTYLAYAAASHSASLGVVDLVMSLEGVQQGTYLAAVFYQLDASVDSDPDKAAVRDQILDAVKPVVKHDPRRPLFEDVTPGSPNIRYTNEAVAVPNEPNYVNVDGDVVLNVIDSFFFVQLSAGTYAVGDYVMLPGSDDPRDVPELGGARFLPSAAGRGASSTEWELRRTMDLHIDPSVPGTVVTSFEIQNILDAPEAHTNLGKKLDQICVQYHGVEHLDAVLFEQIAALDSGLAPAPGTLGLQVRREVSCP